MINTSFIIVLSVIIMMYIDRHESILMSAGYSFVVFLVSTNNAKLADVLSKYSPLQIDAAHCYCWC